MLYNKKPDLRNLHEWGSAVWVHTTGGMKLDGRSKNGRWIGFDETSKGHRIYWPKRRNVTIERSLKFSNEEILILPNRLDKQIQGENSPVENASRNMNLQNNPEDKSAPQNKSENSIHTESHQQNLETERNNQDQNPSTSSNQKVNEPTTTRSQRIRIPTRYVRDIQSGIGTVDGQTGRNDLPSGIHISKPILEIEGENESEGQIEHAMAADIPEIEAINPISLDEAK